MMNGPAPSLAFDRHPVGSGPSVVGVLTRLDTLLTSAANPAALPCHLVELRLGEIPADAPWEEPCRRLSMGGRPVLATLRNNREGGKWEDEDPARLEIFRRALGCCAAVDVEWQSALRDQVLTLAREAGKPVVCSYHDFSRTPPLHPLLDLAKSIAQRPAVVVKLALRVNGPEDMVTLRTLLHDPFPAPRCVIGMGELASSTRVDFAREGSCLTYGWLDAPTAPGQPSCEELMRQLG
jgi:3-dehydroquinate dehydratase-1